jgi:hypothetical protein
LDSGYTNRRISETLEENKNEVEELVSPMSSTQSQGHSRRKRIKSKYAKKAVVAPDDSNKLIDN